MRLLQKDRRPATGSGGASAPPSCDTCDLYKETTLHTYSIRWSGLNIPVVVSASSSIHLSLLDIYLLVSGLLAKWCVFWLSQYELAISKPTSAWQRIIQPTSAQWQMIWQIIQLTSADEPIGYQTFAVPQMSYLTSPQWRMKQYWLLLC